jgi:Photoprotection regulator fluorescence recovery protein
MSSRSVTRNRFPYPNEAIWSKPERAIARKAFDAALNREVQDVMREAKQMANKIKEPADVWALERYLTQRRRDIDRKYEFRSSRLTQILGMFLSERRILEEELRGLREDKIKAIRTCAELLSEDAAGLGF